MPFSTVGIFLRGLLMGAADIIPGVSGGTIAFITGIYDTLLGSIRSFDLQFLAKVFRLDIAGAWQHVNGTFLLALLLGIATSIFSLAQLVSWLLEAHPVPLWAFFFGLILASALVLLWEVRQWSAAVVLSLLIGVGIALLISFSPAIRLDFGLVGVFLAGFVAICAMILPGISGSFVLVLLGMYGPVLEAIKAFDVVFILVFVLGCGSGLLCFSRVLHWLLHHYHQATMALLTGFLFGSLPVVWPWKRVVQWAEDSHGELQPVQQFPVLPGDFYTHSGQDAQLWFCILLAMVGFVLVWQIHARWGHGEAT